MKKYICLFGIALFAYSCSVEPFEQQDDNNLQNEIESYTSQTKSILRIDNSLFIMENGIRYAIDPNVITVKLNPRVKTTRNINQLRSNHLGYIDIQVPEGVDVEKYVSLLEKSGEYISVDYNTFGEWCYSPNDTHIREQWYLNTINALSVWDVTAGSSDIKVAVVDSGVDVNHNDLGVGSDGYSNVDTSLGWNYITNNRNVVTTNEHGTRVAGILAAKVNNGKGIAGVAGGKGSKGITIIPYCVGVNFPDFAVLDDAILDAVEKGVRVINLSLSGSSTSAVTAAINYATKNNVIVICASGNGYASSVSYPASLSNVIAVGATDQSNTRADFSNYGANLDVVAPGVDILSH